MWVYNPALIMQGGLLETIIAVATALAGIVALSGAVQGYLFGPTKWHERVLLFAAALALIKPGLMSDLIGASLLGLALLSRYLLARADFPAQSSMAADGGDQR